MLAKLPFSTSLILLFPRPSLEIEKGTFNYRLIEIHNSTFFFFLKIQILKSRYREKKKWGKMMQSYL